MDYNIEYTADSGIIISLKENATGNTLLETNRVIYSDEESLKKIKYQLIDLTELGENTPITLDELFLLAEQDQNAQAINPNMYYAIVSSRRVDLALTNLWQSNTDLALERVKFFESLEDAKKWITEL